MTTAELNSIKAGDRVVVRGNGAVAIRTISRVTDTQIIINHSGGWVQKFRKTTGSEINPSNSYNAYYLDTMSSEGIATAQNEIMHKMLQTKLSQTRWKELSLIQLIKINAIIEWPEE